MREEEGARLAALLEEALCMLEEKTKGLRQRRVEGQKNYRQRITKKIQLLFEAFPIKDLPLEQILESRISQELALLLDRTDIEEELNRLENHLQQARQTLQFGGALGKKMEFILQEISREVNTLGSKAQDYLISQEVIQMKVLVEQLREQTLNLE